ncbi:MAG: DUF5123 domain-containing protein [Mangrovibacterium sp.]
MNFKKRININLIFATLAGLLLFSACVDKNDWDVDSSYSRMFRPANLAVTGVTATTADVNFVAIPGSAYYLVELSQDSLVFENIVATLDTTANLFTLENLDGNTAYSIRVKAVSEDQNKEGSAWSALYFKTRAEQIMEPVLPGDIMSRSVNLRWTAGATVTRLVVFESEDEPAVVDIELSEGAISSGALKVSGLSPETSYVAFLLNDTKQRGSATFTTYPDVPDADLLFMMEATDVLTQETFDTLTVSSVTFAFPAGSFYTFDGTLMLPTDVDFNFFGLPGNEKAILNIKQIELGASHGFVKFTNLDLSGIVYDATGAPTAGTNDYLFNQSGTTNTNTLEFSNCLIHDYRNTPLRMKDSADKYIENLIINNCVVYNTPDSYYVINVSAANHVIDNISITNSTFHNIGRMFLHNKSNNSSIVIADCTFNNMIASGRYFLDMGSFGPSGEFAVTNCIFGDTADDNAKGIRASSAPVVTNSYSTADFILGGSSISGLNSYLGLSTDLFADPANGDFTIADELFDGKSSTGDPRWRFQ